MKTLLLNDTSAYHFGCKQVVDIINQNFAPIYRIATTEEIDTNLISTVDQVILNGEGTIHNNRANAVKFLKYLEIAQKLGKKTSIINTVWQNMDPMWVDVLNKCDIIEVREVLSYQCLQKMGVESNVVLDLSIHKDVIEKPVLFNDVYTGGVFPKGRVTVDWDTKPVDIFTQSWDELVNTLRNSKLLITGRHHEMYAALKARTPVIALPGNTWKNEGFFHTLEAEKLLISPTKENIDLILNGAYDKEWNKVWEYLDKYEYKYSCDSK